MAGLARALIPGVPHHVTRRGNGRDAPAPETCYCLSSASEDLEAIMVFGRCMDRHCNAIPAPDCVPCARIDGRRAAQAEIDAAHTGGKP